ncbi:MAG: V-type ATP synthase subunit A, partial [Erysipelotrichaceae bacterium]
MSENVIYSINGPVVKVKNARDFSMMEMVFVGNKRLMGEVISISKDATVIQVYESTTSLAPGEPVFASGAPISVTLGPGILRNIFDGIERPLKEIAKESGAFIATGSNVEPLDVNALWDVSICVKVGDELQGGSIYARIPETDLIEHRCMVMPGLSGVVESVKENGQYHIHDCIVTLRDKDQVLHELTLCQKWPIKKERPVKKRLPISVPLITGQRVIDTLFPIAKGGTAAIPGGFGTGKTMTQHQLAKWCDADIIIYVGCGERGNEMTQVLEEFSELIDPKSQKPLTDRTVLIANTSNMPVAAREASIYT